MVNFLPTIRLTQSIWKRKFPSIDKPLQKQVPQKGPLKNICPGAYFRNFTVCLRSQAIKKIQGPRFQRNYIIARDEKSDLHGTSFQSSPKINHILITRSICIQWKFTTPDHRSFSKTFFFFFQLVSSVHLFQSNQRFEAIQFMGRHVLEKL